MRGSMKGIHFHGLPLNNTPLLKAWLTKMKLKNPCLSVHSKVCSNHFTSDCYLRDLQSELTNSKPRFMLKKDAVPTIFDFSEYKQVTDIPTQPDADSRKRSKERLERRKKRESLKQRQEVQFQKGVTTVFS